MTGAWDGDGPSTIVVGVDGSDASWRALHYAIGLARRQDSHVVAVFVTQLLAASPGFPDPPSCTATELESQLAFEVDALVREDGVPIDFVIGDGDPVTAIAAVADERRADLIVIGASEKVTHRVLGSVAIPTIKTRAFRSRCCPVTVVP